MPTLRRATYTRDIPSDAVPCTARGKPAVRYTGRDGKPVVALLTADGGKCRVESNQWYARIKDATRVLKNVPLAVDKTAAQAMLGDMLRRVERERAGVVAPHEEHRRRPLADLLAEYKRHLLDRGNGKDHAAQVARRCQAVFTGVGAVLLADLDATAAEGWLADQRRTNPRFGAQNSNHHVANLKAFGNWLTRARRAADNPFRFLSKLNVAVDVRHRRRGLSVDEFAGLLAAAESDRPFRGLPGGDRAMLYRVAAYSGLRASELASLTPASFDLSADPPTVTVEAGYSKRKRRDQVPLHPDLVTLLRDWLTARDAGERLWPGRWAADHGAVDLIRRDLANARMAYLTAATGSAERERREGDDFLTAHNSVGEVIDFHSLRHQFVTSLVAAGVAPKDAQALARHSTITLTLDRYAHVGIRDTAAAVARLPALPGVGCKPAAESVRLRATGTDGQGTILPEPCPNLALTGDDPGRLLTNGRASAGPNDSPEVLGFPGLDDAGRRQTSGAKVPAVRIERTTPGLGNSSGSGDSLGKSSDSEAGTPRTFPSAMPADPELAAVIDAWGALPYQLRAAITAIVRSWPRT